jgi:hypothetical protein
VAPAIITRVWSDDVINVRVICDSENTLWKTSVKLFDTEAEAREHASTGLNAAFWPPRV